MTLAVAAACAGLLATSTAVAVAGLPAATTAPAIPTATATAAAVPAGGPAVVGRGRTRAAASAAVAQTFRAGGNGYWAVWPSGTVDPAAPAVSYGDLSRYRLAEPIVGMAATGDGGGYWLVASDGGIFSFGDARFHGSTGGVRLAQPVVGMAATPDGGGYWLVASDGGIFSFGDARFHGSTGGVRLAQPVVGMAATPDGGGYWLAGRDGGIFNFGDARFHGSGSGTLAQEGQTAVGVAGAGQGGYWIESSSGQPLAMDAPLSVRSPSSASGPSAAGSGPMPVGQVPASSTSPSAAFMTYCMGPGYSPSACDRAALADIDAARAAEGYGPMSLPWDYSVLPLTSQLIVTADAERSARGLPSLPEDSNLDGMAQAGARSDTDPTGPAGYGWASNWAYAYPTALAADFVWMYDDGPGSSNIDCTASNSTGCWGHRRNILSPWPGRAGAGAYQVSGGMSLTQLFVENY